MSKELSAIHGRLFNHRPFLQGEIRTFVKEFEEKRKDREVEDVFKALELVTELRDCEVDRLRAQCQSALPTLSANLEAANAACAKILDKSGGADVEAALESSRQARDKEWEAFVADAQDRFARIDEAYDQKELELSNQFKELDKQLSPTD